MARAGLCSCSACCLWADREGDNALEKTFSDESIAYCLLYPTAYLIHCFNIIIKFTPSLYFGWRTTRRLNLTTFRVIPEIRNQGKLLARNLKRFTSCCVFHATRGWCVRLARRIACAMLSSSGRLSEKHQMASLPHYLEVEPVHLFPRKMESALLSVRLTRRRLSTRAARAGIPPADDALPVFDTDTALPSRRLKGPYSGLLAQYVRFTMWYRPTFL